MSNSSILVKFSKLEFEAIEKKSQTMEISKTAIVREAVRAYFEKAEIAKQPATASKVGQQYPKYANQPPGSKVLIGERVCSVVSTKDLHFRDCENGQLLKLDGSRYFSTTPLLTDEGLEFDGRLMAEGPEGLFWDEKHNIYRNSKAHNTFMTQQQIDSLRASEAGNDSNTDELGF